MHRHTGSTPVKTLWRMASRNVLRNWRHSLATVLAMASGFAAVSLFDGFLRDLHDRNVEGYQRRGMLGNVVVTKKGLFTENLDDPFSYYLSKADQDILEAFFRQDPDFVQRQRFLAVTGISSRGSYNGFFIGVGYDLAEGLEMRGPRWGWNVQLGLPLHLARGLAVEIGAGLARSLECMAEGPVPLSPEGTFIAVERPLLCSPAKLHLTVMTEGGQVNLMELPISAVGDSGSVDEAKRSINMPLGVAQSLLDTDKVSQIGVQLTSEAASEPFMARLRTHALSRGLDLALLHWWEHPSASFATNGLDMLRVVRSLFLTIVVAIAVMSIANTMMKAVNERFREIGTLRSLGMPRQDVLILFSLEGLATSLMGCILGLAVTLAGAFLIALIGIKFNAGFLPTPIPVHIASTPTLWLISAALLSSLATATAYVCARRASRMVVADLLRHV